jgi:hypothetical protein
MAAAAGSPASASIGRSVEEVAIESNRDEN